MRTEIELVKADIIKIKADAIVNAANTSLLGGGGVDGAIHRAAGHELLKECIELDGCRIGQAKITKGYNLLANYVIHTVGPVWGGGRHGEERLLASCYQSCLGLVKSYKLRTIAFPSISTGVYRFPIELAAPIALKTTLAFLKTNPDILEKVIFVLFSGRDFEIYSTRYKELT